MFFLAKIMLPGGGCSLPWTEKVWVMTDENKIESVVELFHQGLDDLSSLNLHLKMYLFSEKRSSDILHQTYN